MYYQFNIQQFYVLSTQCIYVFCVDLRTNSDYFPIQHQMGTAVAQWLKCCARNLKVAGSIPDGVIGIFFVT